MFPVRLSRSMASKFVYVHPLSDAVLSELKRLSPPWFDAKNVIMHEKEGTFGLPFRAPVNSVESSGLLQTVYDKESRNHFLVVHFGGLAGRVSLMDGSKSAWQANVGDDLARITGVVGDLVQRVDDATKGILPNDGQAAKPLPRPRPEPAFPFPDNVRPPEG